MRDFSDFEKTILRLICEIKLESNDTFLCFLQKNYFSKERKQALLIKHDTQDVIFYLTPEIFNNEIKRVREIKNLWIIFSLIQYLIEQRLITNIPIKNKPILNFVYEECDKLSLEEPNKFVLNSIGDYLLPSNPGEILDISGEIKFQGVLWKEIYSTISENLTGIIIPSEGILYLVNNGFKSVEDKRYNMQLKLTWLGIIISILLGAYGIFSDTFNFDKKLYFESEILKKVSSIEIESKKPYQNKIYFQDSIKKHNKLIDNNQMKADTVNLYGK